MLALADVVLGRAGIVVKKGRPENIFENWADQMAALEDNATISAVLTAIHD